MQQTLDHNVENGEFKLQDEQGEGRLGTEGKGEEGLETDIDLSPAIHRAPRWAVLSHSFSQHHRAC